MEAMAALADSEVLPACYGVPVGEEWITRYLGKPALASAAMQALAAMAELAGYSALVAMAALAALARSALGPSVSPSGVSPSKPRRLLHDAGHQ